MQRFHFHWRTQGTIIHDREGTQLPDLAAARTHGVAVATELMWDAGEVARLWSLRVEHEDGTHAFDLFFVDVDAKLSSQSQERRILATATCRRLSALADVRCALSTTLVESHMLLARATGRPNLVCAGGRIAISASSS